MLVLLQRLEGEELTSQMSLDEGGLFVSFNQSSSLAVLTLPVKREEGGKLSTEVYNHQYIPCKSALSLYYTL
jgi:hypothetical protein